MNVWRRWATQPQSLFVRKALFQIHLWTGIAVGLHVFAISLTGSILVYRNELYRFFSPQPRIVSGAGTPMSDEALAAAARRAFPGYEIGEARPGEAPNHAVEVTLALGDDEPIRRLFHPFTGENLGNPLPLGYRVTAWMLDLHDNLLYGQTGRQVNGVGALLLVVLCLTGLVIWWPGSKKWRRSLTIERRASWFRFAWTLHSAFGFWLFLFLLMWGLTGAYLSLPAVFASIFDYIEPFDENSPVERIGDRIQYWLAYLHFGRLGGRGIPWCGRGLCNSITKATWAVIGLVPPAMFVTGAFMWWSRVLRPGRVRLKTTLPHRASLSRNDFAGGGP